MSGGALVCDKTKIKKKTKKKIENREKKRNKKSRARIVFFVRLVRARFVIAKSAASSIKWTMMMGRRATGARETKCRIRQSVERKMDEGSLEFFQTVTIFFSEKESEERK